MRVGKDKIFWLDNIDMCIDCAIQDSCEDLAKLKSIKGIKILDIRYCDSYEKPLK